MTRYDLHTHTTCSDGTTTPSDNVREAVALGLRGIGLTDHDTTAGYAEAMAAADGTGLEVVPGVEFSAEHDGLSVHVLGFWVDPGHDPLADELHRLRNERSDRARRIVERFADLGFPIRLERVLELAAGAPIGRPHIAQAVVETGAVSSTREVFDRYLGDGRPANVPKHAVGPVRAVELLVAAGGVAVLAHPGLYDGRDASPGIEVPMIEEMAAAGLAGIEADHPDHSADQRAHYADVAAALDLAVTAGSDYHGAAKENLLGCATTPPDVVERLRGWQRS